MRAQTRIFFSLLLCLPGALFAQVTPEKRRSISPMVEELIAPVRIVWTTDPAQSTIIRPERLLSKGTGQALLSNGSITVFKSDKTVKPAILLDFGKEIHGKLQVVTGRWPGNKPIRVRIRLGESASEAMSEIDTIKGATNDHAIRDMVVNVPWLGKLEVGGSGFRFARIDLLEENIELQLREVNAVAVYRDIPYLGSFSCSDTLLNKIWQTGAYTVHLNMQDYLWDGIKRDRLVWVGDMHPEVATINAVFGYQEVVQKSLDLSRDTYAVPSWMNGISTYSMWWLLIQRDLYQHHGDLVYLKQQQDYLVKLLNHLVTKIDANNIEKLDGNRFLDWPSSENPQAVHAGLQSLLVITLKAGAELCTILKDQETSAKCQEAVNRLMKHVPDINHSKQAAALLSLAELIPAKTADQLLSANGAKGFSTFYGYYMLQAMAKAGNYQGAMNIIREYWGAMLKLGATTFWEDFNMDWVPNSVGITQLVPAGMNDIHGDFGAYCYKGFRHSLCHGWASGPTPWLTEHVLGIKVIAAGCKVIQMDPHLGDLAFAEGSFPTPYGIVKVKHTKTAGGKVRSVISAPKQVKIIKNKELL